VTPLRDYETRHGRHDASRAGPTAPMRFVGSVPTARVDVEGKFGVVLSHHRRHLRRVRPRPARPTEPRCFALEEAYRGRPFCADFFGESIGCCRSWHRCFVTR